jgi:ribosomal protein S18 acetylase RimI-like enzyme
VTVTDPHRAGEDTTGESPVLIPYADQHAEVVLSWAPLATDLRWWFGLTGVEEDDRRLFDGWQREADNDSYVLLDGSAPVAYGELWREPGEVELAHLMVDPRRQRQGLGTRLVHELTTLARQDAEADVFLRVQTGNAIAIACYFRCGYRRMSPEEEAEFNAGQPQAYTWMRPTGAR